MQINVTGRHLEITESIERHVTQRAEKLPRYFNSLQQVDVVIGKTGDHTFKSEFICHIDNHQHVVASAKSEDMHASLDAASAKAERQLHDLKEKLSHHH